jgi:hypothetical protein
LTENGDHEPARRDVGHRRERGRPHEHGGKGRSARDGEADERHHAGGRGLGGDRPDHHEHDLHPEHDQGERSVVELDADHHGDREQRGEPDDAERHQPPHRHHDRWALIPVEIRLDGRVYVVGIRAGVRVVGGPLAGARFGRGHADDRARPARILNNRHVTPVEIT